VNGSVTVSPVSVPEPGSLSMLFMGLALCVVVARWRQRANATVPVRH
jgi:hypothetical protein